MSPAHIESRLKGASFLIGSAVVVGDRRPYNVALLVLDHEGAAAYARQAGLGDRSVAELAEEPAVLEAVAAAVEQANSQLSSAEQIKRFRVLDVEWQPGDDEVTPTMKTKRTPILGKYAAEIEELYAVAAVAP